VVLSIQNETAGTTVAVESSRASIEVGQKRTNEANQMLAHIIHSASQTETLAKGAASAVVEQSSASKQIAANAEQVAELAADSLSASEEAAKTGKVILASAMHLSQVVLQFKL